MPPWYNETAPLRPRLVLKTPIPADFVNVYSYAKQVRFVLLVEAVFLVVAFGIAYAFWNSMCPDSWESCVGDGVVTGPGIFLVLSAVRPFVFTPLLLFAVIGGKTFGPVLGAILCAVGGVLSCALVFGLAKLVGRRLVKPWLRANLPATFKFIRSQDYKLVFALRLIPVLPFDLMSVAFGALDFRFRAVMVATLLGTLPEAYLFAKLVDPTETLLSATAKSAAVFGVCVILPLIVFEYFSRKKGGGLWQTVKDMTREINYEVRSNNDIVKRQSFDPEKTPVLLLYGFFSSRRAVTVLERMLTARGHQVLSFNLGGLLGTFFTRDILETANFIDYKIKRQVERHGFKKIHVVAHSKGGMVALWWALKLGGAKYCDRIITMGTPYKGSALTYLALVTPIGLFWRDMGQMRPGSMFLKSLHDVEVPEGMKVYCIHSDKDRVAKGPAGIFRPRKDQEGRVVAVPMHHISHFEFLYRRDVGETISRILKDDEPLPLGAEPVPPASEVPESEAPTTLPPASITG